MKLVILSNVRRPDHPSNCPDDVQPGFGAGEIVETSPEAWWHERPVVEVQSVRGMGECRVMKSQLLPLFSGK